MSWPQSQKSVGSQLTPTVGKINLLAGLLVFSKDKFHCGKRIGNGGSIQSWKCLQCKLVAH